MNCPYCKRYFAKKQLTIDHINKYHGVELEQSGMDAAQSLYFSTHGTLSASCMCGCGKETGWNKKTGKPYKVSPDPECRKRLYKKADDNMMAARNVHVHTLLHDMQHQTEMQERRPTYGKYKFHDGGEVGYLSKLEQNFLKFCDIIMEFTSNMILTSPEVFQYDDPTTGETRQYIPDYYLPDYNLLIEIKDGGKYENKNPAFIKETKYKVALKDNAMRKQTKYNYIRINGANYGPFVEMLYQIVHVQAPDPNPRKSVIVITEAACTDMDELMNFNAPDTIPTNAPYYLVIGKLPGTNLHTMSAISNSRTCANWIISSVSGQMLYYTNYSNSLFVYSYAAYKYIGNIDMTDVYNTLFQLSSIPNNSDWDLIQILGRSGIWFDDGHGVCNNNHRKSMFTKVDLNKIIAEVFPIEPELFTGQYTGS